MDFDLSAYLARIGHRPAPPSAAGLAALQAAQLRAIPFENTEPFLGRVPDLSHGALRQKIVAAGRGGYCLELNRLFGGALAALGYAARPILGRVRMGAAAGGPRAHLAHVVTLAGRDWLADTGFGGPGPEHPLRLDTAGAQDDRLGRFRLRPDAATGETVLERATPDGWFALYGFDAVPVTAPDIEAANVVCSRWALSPFPHHLMLNRVTADGRVSLFDRQVSDGEGQRALAGVDDLARVLATRFALPADTAPALWARLAPEAEGVSA